MASSQLLERDDELRLLGEAVDLSSAGRGSVVVIRAPAGAGKTALVHAAVTMATERDVITLGAHASRLDHGFPFGVVHQLLEQVVHDRDPSRRARLFEGAAGRAEMLFGVDLPEVEPDYGVLSGLHWLLANLADEGPLLLHVDDLQWADEPSLRLIEFLARRIADLPIALVCTWRSGDHDRERVLLDAIATAPGATVLSPAALGPASVGAMLERALGGEPSTVFRDVAWEATGGNPLLTTVLGTEAAEHGLRGESGECDRVVSLAARGVAPAIERRLRALGGPAATVATSTAVLGERAGDDDVAALSGLTTAETRTERRRLADAQILADEGWAFVHPLVQAAVLALSTPAAIDHLRRSAAHRLRAAGASPSEVALQWLAVTPTGDANAVADLRSAAGIAAAEGSVVIAIDLLRRALLEDVKVDRAALLFELARLELRTHDPAGVERMRSAMALGLDADDEVRAHAALGMALSVTDPVSAFAEIDAARGRTDDRRLRLRLDAAELDALMFLDDHAERRGERLRAIAGAESPSQVELAHLTVATAFAGGPTARVLELAERAIGDGHVIREVGLDGGTWNLLGHCLRLAEHPATARRLLRILEREVRAHGLRAAGAYVDQSWAYWHRDFGSVARGLAHAEAAYDVITEVGMPVTLVAAAAVTAECLVLLDRVEVAQDLLDAVPIEAAVETFIGTTALSARGFVHLTAGRFEPAEADLRRVLELIERRGWDGPPTAGDRLRLAELLNATGRSADVLPLTDRALRVARASGTHGVEGAMMRVRAAALDGDDRTQTLRGSVAALARSPLRLQHGQALLALGVDLRHRGELVESRQRLYEALDLATLTESTWLARRTHDELRASGARPRRARSSGVRALTAAERRVAELAAEGLGNREVADRLWLSRKTVEYHLGRIYAKLGIGSRAELPTALDPVAGADAGRTGER